MNDSLHGQASVNRAAVAPAELTVDPNDPRLQLAAMLATVAEKIARGECGDVTECVLSLEGKQSALIVTFPQETQQATDRRLARALNWMRSGKRDAR